MTQHSFSFLTPITRIKGQHHLLLLGGLGYFLPLSFLGGGLAIAQSTSSSEVQPLPSLDQGNASTLESIEPSVEEPTAVPNYESIPPMRLNQSEATPQPSVEPKQDSPPQIELKPSKPATVEAQAAPHETPRKAPHEEARNAPHEEARSQQQANSKLKPIQPLVNPSATQTPEVSPEPAPKPEPTVQFEQRQPQPNPIAPSPQLEPPAREGTANANQDFIDLNGYPQPGEELLPPPRVEVSDREPSCTTVIENGELVSGNCNLSQDGANTPQSLVEVENLPALPQTFQQPAPRRQRAISIPPRPREIRSTYTPPTDLPQLKLPGNGDSGMIFPLSTASAISSNYGWRLHPIFGNRRFHTGTDFVAPEGTPVVATKSGRVVLADYNSGYGLIVGLRHDDSNESRYAHLSQIHVKPGQWVEQGTIIGRVGNTGLSTGPHLHFEWRIRKGSRWIAVNAGEQLIAARANLDPSRIHFADHLEGEEETVEQGSNFLAFLPEMLASIPAPPASWMSLPELPFLKNSNFAQAHDRRAPLARFSQRNNSVLVLPFSLPKVLASVLKWEPPQLFAQDNFQRVQTRVQRHSEDQFAYRSPSAENSSNPYQQVSEFLSEQENIASLTNLDSLGTPQLNFPSPRREESQQISDKRKE